MIRVKQLPFKLIIVVLVTMFILYVGYQVDRKKEMINRIEYYGLVVMDYKSEIHWIFDGYEVLVSSTDDAGFDKVMPYLVELNRLKAMDIQKASITKESLMKLADLDDLEIVSLIGAGDFTLEDVMELKKVAPDLRIIFEFEEY